MESRQLSLPINIPSRYFKKSNDFIRNRVLVEDVLGGRILASFISLLKKNDIEFIDYAIPASSVLPKGCSGRSYQQLKESCRSLAKSVIERKLDNTGGFVFNPIFMRIGYEDGIIYGRFSPEVKDLLLELKSHFTLMDLFEYNDMPTIYSQKLFELVVSYSSMKVAVVELKDLHRILNTPESLIASYKDFRIRVLEKCHSLITKRTSIKYRWEPISVKRKVYAIKFFFEDNSDRKKTKLTTAKRQKTKNNEKEIQINNDLAAKCTSCWEKFKLSTNPCGCRLTNSPKGDEVCASCLTLFPTSIHGA